MGFGAPRPPEVELARRSTRRLAGGRAPALGTGGFLLARRLHVGVAGAFICGLIFAFAPPRFFRLGQLHLTAVQWIPFSLAFLHTYLERGTRRDLLRAAACFSLQALSSGHGAAYLLVSTIALLGWHAARGGGIGSYWGNLRSIGEKVGMNGKTSGVVPFIRVMDSLTLAISQGSLRRG